MENDMRTNAKSLSQKEQYQIRKSVIRLAQLGHSAKETARLLDVSERLVYATKKAYKEHGSDGIKPGKRGRRTGDKRTLTPEQEREIMKTIVDKNPEQLKLKCCMWTRKAIHEYILREYKIDMPLVSLGVYLRRWGFSVQRPTKRAARQDEARVKAWMEDEYPGIVEKSRCDDAEIYWGDETALQNTANYMKGYAPKGKTPVVEIETRKMKLNMLSAVSNKGKLRFTITKESVNVDILIDFMRRLVKDSDRKVYLILDNLKVHHGKKVRAWLDRHKGEIEVFYLPPYSPEYNPDEYLNSDLKRSMERKPLPKSEADLRRNARSFMKHRQMHPEKVQGYFRHKSTEYASEKNCNV
jgi:transposase